MPEKTKPTENDEACVKKTREKTPSANHLIEDKKTKDEQEKGGYYYDDSYGYEIYNPDEEDD